MRRDRILKKIIPQHPEVWLTSRGTPFVTLARAIVGQQISSKAADAVWTKFIDAVGKRPTPVAVLDLAVHFGERRVHPEKWAAMDDEAVISELVAIRGIGRWTAEMFLIFNLQRPDVLPLDDLGLLKAISLHYFSGEPVSRFEAREVSLAWQPWRTVATWYLWRSLEPTPVQY
jgi:DNA-3-methyladenine glycosylase II